MAKIFTTWTLNKEISLLGNQNVETTIAAFESSIPASSLMAKFFTTWTCGILVRLVIRKEGQFESTEIAVENSMKHTKIFFQNYLRFNDQSSSHVKSFVITVLCYLLCRIPLRIGYCSCCRSIMDFCKLSFKNSRILTSAGFK